MRKLYAGIGSRETPADVCARMTRIAVSLHKRGFRLRTGGAAGADAAWQAGAGTNIEVYRPKRQGEWDKARAIAASHHEAWHKCSIFAKELHTRNVLIILGPQLDNPVAFVLCWAPNPYPSAALCQNTDGGTGMGVRIAAARGIPVLHLDDPDGHAKLNAQVAPAKYPVEPTIG